MECVAIPIPLSEGIKLLLFAGLLPAIGLGFVVMFFWFLVQVRTGFTLWGNDSSRMKRDGGLLFISLRRGGEIFGDKARRD